MLTIAIFLDFVAARDIVFHNDMYFNSCDICPFQIHGYSDDEEYPDGPKYDTTESYTMSTKGNSNNYCKV